MSDPNQPPVRRIAADGLVPTQYPPTRPQPPRPSMQPAPANYGEQDQGCAPQPGYAFPEGQPAPTRLPPAQEPPAPAAAEDGLVVLSRPYQAHGEMIDRIRLRRPVTKDIKRIGNPLTFLRGPDGAVRDVEMKWDVIAAYIPVLSNPPLPPSTVDQFDYFDLDACAAVIAPFFIRL